MRSTQYTRSWLYALLVAAFFLCARAGSVAHAANYGSAPHNHDSKICVFSVLAQEEDEDDEGDEHDDIALPPVEIYITAPSPIFIFSAPSIQKAWSAQTITKTARAPPGQ